VVCFIGGGSLACPEETRDLLEVTEKLLSYKIVWSTSHHLFKLKSIL
jgi:hypothetical protein